MAMNGAAARIKDIYVFAYGAIVSVEPRAMTMRSIYRNPMTVIAAPHIKDPKQPVEAVRDAVSVSFAPRALEMMLPEP